MSVRNRRSEIIDRLRRKILSGLTLGLIRDGERLPGVRAIAAELGVNARVVLSAYEELEEKGVVERRDRSGVYAKAQSHDQIPFRNSWVVDVAMEALQHGLRPSVLGHQLTRVFESREMHALVLDCNDDQLWSLADELTQDYGLKVTTADLDLLALGTELPEMATPPDVVVTTSFHSDEVAILAARLKAPMITVTMCTDLFIEVNHLMETQDVYFIVSDGRMARKLERIFEESDHKRRLRVLVQGREDLEQIPAAAPVYITRLTRTRIPDSALLRRCLPEARVFSRESARDLISLVVQAGMNSIRSTQSA